MTPYDAIVLMIYLTATTVLWFGGAMSTDFVLGLHVAVASTITYFGIRPHD